MAELKIDIKRVKSSDDLEAICSQMKPGLWGKDNEMSSYNPNLLGKFLDAGHVLIVALSGVKIVGAAIAYELPHPGGEHSLYVHELDTHPDFRRQNVATLVMQEMMKVAAERQLAECWLSTEVDNIAANNFYKKLHPYEIEPSVVYAYKVKEKTL